MLQKFELQGIHMKLDQNLTKYAQKKIGNVDKYLARSIRQSAHAEVQLKEGKAKDNNHCTCEVTMYLPRETIFITESTLNMYAAIDIVELKLKQQLRKYKEMHSGGTLRRRLFARSLG